MKTKNSTLVLSIPIFIAIFSNCGGKSLIFKSIKYPPCIFINIFIFPPSILSISFNGFRPHSPHIYKEPFFDALYIVTIIILYEPIKSLVKYFRITSYNRSV